jgi:hypothetical protein
VAGAEAGIVAAVAAGAVVVTVAAVAIAATAARPLAIHLRVFMTTTLPPGPSAAIGALRPLTVG